MASLVNEASKPPDLFDVLAEPAAEGRSHIGLVREIGELLAEHFGIPQDVLDPGDPALGSARPTSAVLAR